MYQPATQEQKTKLVKLSNSPQITRFEKTKVFRDIYKLSSERAAVMIARLKKWAGDRRPHIPSGSFKAPVFSAVSSSKADTRYQLERVAELAAEQADEWQCGACYGSGWRYDPNEGECHKCDGTGVQRRWHDLSDDDCD